MSDISAQYDVIIIGTGHAGYTLAKLLRKRTHALSLLMVTLDNGASYSKPMLSNGLAKSKSVADLAVHSAAQMSGNLDAVVLTNCSVCSIDAPTRTIETTGGIFAYQSLVLASGAQQIRLPIDGDGVEDVLTVNGLADYGQFLQRLHNVERVAVMGPGLIGCEFANDLAAVGKTAVIIGPDTRALERLVPAAASIALMAAMDTLKIEWRLQTVVMHIDKTPVGYQLLLTSGETVSAGLVLSAAGLKPDLALSLTAGLETAQGIVVDRQMCTSDPFIYAIGDCAEVAGLVLPYILPIMHSARALSATLTGEPTAVVYPAMPVLIKTPVHPVVVASPPPGIEGQWQTESEHDGVRAIFVDRKNTMQGFVLTGSHVSAKGKLERELPKLLS